MSREYSGVSREYSGLSREYSGVSREYSGVSRSTVKCLISHHLHNTSVAKCTDYEHAVFCRSADEIIMRL